MICFHQIYEPNGYLSNWYLSEFSEDGIKYNCVEQYMMAGKARTFQDSETEKKILAATDPAEIKRLGREVKGYQDIIWNGVRQIIVYNGLILKFTQNQILLDELLETGNEILAECAVHDRIWGIGLSMTDPDRLNMGKWRGQNLLGFSLMQVREELADRDN